MSRVATRHHVEQRIHRQRVAERRQDELQQHLKDHSRAAGRSLSELRGEGLFRQRQEAVERKELLTDYAYIKAEQDKERKKHIADVQESLATELERRRVANVREEVSRRRICEGSEELRALKGRLQAASVNKARAMQLLERQAKEEEDYQRECKMVTQLENWRLEDLEREHNHEQAKVRQRQQVKQMQQEQLIARDAHLREEAEREQMRDRADVEEIVRRIGEEDEMEVAERRARQEQARNLYREGMQERHAYQVALERKEADDNARIEEFAREKRAFEDRIAQEKEQQELERRRILQNMLDDQVAQKREAEECDRIRQDYHEEERREAERRLEEAQVRRRLENREEQRQAYEDHMKHAEVKRQLQAEEEHRLREQLLAKFAEDDRIEQMNAQKRRLKVQEHKREVERQLQLRREQYEAARQQEREAFLYLQKEEEEQRRVIEEERRRLLAEAAPLKTFFPKGVLEREADMELVGMTPPSSASGPSVAARGSSRAASLGRPPVLRQVQLGRPFPLRPAGVRRSTSLGRQKAWGTPPSSPEPSAPRDDALGFRGKRPPTLSFSSGAA